MSVRYRILFAVMVLLTVTAGGLSLFLLWRLQNDGTSREPVLIAKVDLPAGTRFDEEAALPALFERKRITKTERPEGAINDPCLLRGVKLAYPVTRGEVVTAEHLLKPSPPRLPEGMVGISVRCCCADSGSAFIRPGIRVDILVAEKVDGHIQRAVAEKLLVLAVDAEPVVDLDRNGMRGPPLISYAASPDEAAAVALAAKRGKLWFSLSARPEGR